MGTTIAFERWMTIAAELLEQDIEARERLLEQRAIDLEDWDRAEEHWSSELARDIARGDLARCKQYADACRREIVRRATESAKAAAPGGGVNVDATLPLVRLDLDKEPLPFQEAPASSAQVRSREIPASLSGSDGETIVPELMRLSIPVTPFDRGSSAMESVDAYAALCAALEDKPSERETVLARFGVANHREAEKLRARWRDRFAADPDLRTRWLRALEERRAKH